MHPCIRYKSWHFPSIFRTQVLQPVFVSPRLTHAQCNHMWNSAITQSLINQRWQPLHKVTTDFRNMNCQYSRLCSSVESAQHQESKKPKLMKDIHPVHHEQTSVKKRRDLSYLEFLKKCRVWQYSSFGQKYLKKKNDLIFSVMSYNVLAQKLLESNDNLYTHCHPESLNWTNRSNALLTEITFFMPDILCLQEVEDQHFGSFFQPKLESLGYDAIYKKRTGDKCDGCAIFFKKDVLELQKKEEVEYRKPGISLMDRDNVAVVALFSPKNARNDSKFCIATTHLLFNPKRDDVRLTQLSHLLATIDKVAFRGSAHHERDRYYPIILCGDFNTEPYSSLYNFARKAKWQSENAYSPQNAKSRRRSRVVDINAIPLSSIGISSNCQFTNLVKSRPCEQSLKSSLSETKFDSSQKTETEGDNRYASNNELSHPFNFMSVYSHFRRNDMYSVKTPEITTHHRFACHTVDYIFYTEKLDQNDRAQSLKLLDHLSLFTQNEVDVVGGLPNRMQASDHLPLVAKFLLQNV